MVSGEAQFQRRYKWTMVLVRIAGVLVYEAQLCLIYPV